MFEVYLYIYDLSNGLAAQISQQLTGRFFKAIYHTSITIHGREYYFGGSGIESSLPSQAPYGQPIEKRKVGETEITPELWHSFLEDCAEEYGVGKYHLLEHNCNTFSDAALQFLLGQRIDPEIASLPSDFLNTSLGMMLRPQIDAMYAPKPNGTTLPNGQGTSVRTEVAVDGPTSGTRKDRQSEAFKFVNTPTLSKLFAKLGEQHGDTAVLGNLQKATELIISGEQGSAAGFKQFNDYLVDYLGTVELSAIYPGLDLMRILLHNHRFATFQVENPQLLHALFAFDYSEDSAETVNTRTVLLKLLSNALLASDLRPILVSRLREGHHLDMLSSTPLSDHAAIRENGLKTIWNLVILADGIDDDWQVACLASVAECSVDRLTPELTELRVKILREIVQGGSEAIQEMVDLLELDLSS